MIVIGERLFFLIAFIVLFTLLSIMRLYFRYTTGDIRRRRTDRVEGFFVIVVRVLLGMPLFATVVLYIWFPGVASWTYLALPVHFRIAGVFMGFASLAGIYLTHRELGRNFSSTLQIKEGHKLVTSGPYRLVRHPMYTSYLLLFIAAFFVSQNWVIGVTGMAIIASLMTIRLRKEEDLLLGHFGREYEQYQQSTGMFLPLTNKVGFRREAEEESSA